MHYLDDIVLVGHDWGVAISLACADLTVTDVGAAGHFLPEDRPTEVAAALSTWLEA
jgi:pimeloyl-ACP methyl ester carboxylesterase